MKTHNTSTRQLITFFVCTYAVSWSFFLIGKQLDILPVILLGVWTPSLTAIILTLFFMGRKGLKQFLGRFGRTKIRWYWWMALLFLPMSMNMVGRSLWEWYEYGQASFEFLPLKYWLGAFLPAILIAGLGEELGWRGFALPRLQKRFTPIVATLILAAVHMLWHLPTYWLGQGMHNVPLVYVLAFLFPWTIIFNWLYNRSGGSLIFAVGFHAISNASLSLVKFLPWESEVPITPDLITMTGLPRELAGPYLSVCAVYAAVAVVVLAKGNFNKVNTDTP